MSAVMGIDPGVRGGLAILHKTGKVVHLQAFAPDLPTRDFANILRTAVATLKSYESSAVFMEKVGHMTGDGGKGSFTFGRVSGMLEMCWHLYNLNVTMVFPMQWQSALGCLSQGNKNVTKNKAKELFPGQKVTHATADSLLIAEFGRRRLFQADRILP